MLPNLRECVCVCLHVHACIKKKNVHVSAQRLFAAVTLAAARVSGGHVRARSHKVSHTRDSQVRLLQL
jgi:hypothetical protein